MALFNRRIETELIPEKSRASLERPRTYYGITSEGASRLCYGRIIPNKQTFKQTNKQTYKQQTNKAATSKRVFLYDQSNLKLSELAVIRNLTGLFT